MTDVKKTISLIAFILEKVGECDEQKVINLLYLIDMQHYYEFGTSITGLTYYHGKNGIEVKAE